jgi:hypothetical protein
MLYAPLRCVHAVTSTPPKFVSLAAIPVLVRAHFLGSQTLTFAMKQQARFSDRYFRGLNGLYFCYGLNTCR